MEYSIACSDVWYLLENFKKEELAKIPTKFIETIRILKLDNYKSKINLDIPLEEQEISEATVGLVSFIYNNYLGTKEDKKEYEKTYKEYESTINGYSQHNFEFKKHNNDNEQKIKNEITIYEEKSNIFLRLLNRIKRIFIK